MSEGRKGAAFLGFFDSSLSLLHQLQEQLPRRTLPLSVRRRPASPSASAQRWKELLSPSSALAPAAPLPELGGGVAAVDGALRLLLLPRWPRSSLEKRGGPAVAGSGAGRPSCHLLPLPPSQCEAKQRLGAFRALTCGATGRRPLRFLLLRLPCRRRPSVCPTPPSEPAWEQRRGGATTARLRRRRGSQPFAHGCSRRCADRWNAAPFAALFSSLSFLHTGHLQMQLGFAAGDGLNSDSISKSAKNGKGQNGKLQNFLYFLNHFAKLQDPLIFSNSATKRRAPRRLARKPLWPMTARGPPTIRCGERGPRQPTAVG
jgi:hypothetical protein